MDNKQKNRHIIQKFRVRSSHDNLPYACSQRFTRANLSDLYKDFGYTVGAEVGVSKGKHSESMCKADPNLKLYCIDPWFGYKVRFRSKRQEEIYEIACKLLAPYNAHIIRKTSMDALDDFEDESLDFVYIDGNHQYDFIAPDLIFWARKVRKGGMIACHDYCHFHWSGVIKAVDAYTYCHDIRPWFITKESKPTVFWVKS